MRIAFVGAAQSGKTFSSNLCKHDFGGRVCSFAMPLKLEVFKYLQSVRKGETGSLVMLSKFPDLDSISLPPLSLQHLALTDEEIAIEWINKHKQEVRELLQVWGTDYKRALDDTYWIKQLEPLLETDKNIYVDDCRFMNEADFLASKEFQFIGLTRSTEQKMSHASEVEYKDIIKKYNAPVIENEDVIDLLSAIKKELNFDSGNKALLA